MALNMAIIETPTSAMTASHIVAIPTAPSVLSLWTLSLFLITSRLTLLQPLD